jgi:hypothetical protein
VVTLFSVEWTQLIERGRLLTGSFFLLRILSVHFNILQVDYLDSYTKLIHLKLTTGLSRRIKEADQPKKAPTRKPNTPNKVTTGSIQLLLPTATSRYKKRKMKNNSQPVRST